MQCDANCANVMSGANPTHRRQCDVVKCRDGSRRQHQRDNMCVLIPTVQSFGSRLSQGASGGFCVGVVDGPQDVASFLEPATARVR